MPAATKQGATVRISDKSHRTMRELASTSGEPMQAVLDKALEHYRRQQFWDEVEKKSPQSQAAGFVSPVAAQAGSEVPLV